MTLLIGPGGTGLTFLSWTILYLRGDNTYQTLNNKTVEVDINPLVGQVAHGFGKDHIQNPKDIPKLHQSHSESVIFFVPTHQQDVDTVSNFNCKKIIFDCKDRGPQVFARMMTCLPGSGPILLSSNLNSKYGEAVVRSSLLEFQRFFTNYYEIPTRPDFFRIDYDDVFLHLDQRISNIFEFLNLSVDLPRLSKWLEIYAEYRIRNQLIYDNYMKKIVPVDPAIKLQILKEVIQWTNGSCLPT